MMNNIEEKDWAEDDWHSHAGIDSSCDYWGGDGQAGAAKSGQAGQGEVPLDDLRDADGHYSIARQ